MDAFNGHHDDTHNTPHDTVPFQLPPKGKETRKALTAALQFVLSNLQYAQRQEYSKAKHYQEAEHILAALFDLGRSLAFKADGSSKLAVMPLSQQCEMKLSKSSIGRHS